MATFLNRAVLIIIVTVLVCGCAKSGNPTQPPLPADDGNDDAITESTSPNTVQSNNHQLLAYSLIHVDASDPADVEFEIIPVRSGSLHLNILKLLETGICTDCFKIVGFNFPEPDVLDVDIQITHPLTNLDFTIFDVRGIMMFDGSHLFPKSGLVMSDSSMGDGELLNPDGYTCLYNGSTLGMAGDLQTYFKGKFATPTVPSSDINGYIRHNTDDPLNTRNALYAADAVTETYSLQMPAGQFVLGYAVDANWAMPIDTPVDDPMEDFGSDANCPEPWKIEVTASGSGLTDLGGEVILGIDVFDYQGKLSHYVPAVECPELFGGKITASYKSTEPDYTHFEATVPNEKMAPVGTYKCLVIVRDGEDDPVNAPWLDLTAYQVTMLEVKFGGTGWARDWGKYYSDSGNGVATDGLGNVYVTGRIEIGHYSELNDEWYGVGDAFLAKYSTDGNFAWTRTWGSYYSRDSGSDVATDSSGNVYVTGSFTGTVDFDPGPGIDEHSGGAFISKFDSSGGFKWAQTWNATGKGVATDGSGNIYVTGYFTSTVDFDPGGGTDYHTSNNYADVYLSKFDTSGNFEWARTWGGQSHEYSSGVAVDGSGNVYVTGNFYYTVDFDPDPVDEDLHTSNGHCDVFLSKFDTSGNFDWARTWGGYSWNGSSGIAADDYGNIYVTGPFYYTVDFNPDPVDEDPHTSNGLLDGYLSKFDTSGNFQWARTWGGSGDDQGDGVAVDGSGNINVTGYFQNSVDFDPGSGYDPHTSNGLADVFLSKFDASGYFEWARTWGESDPDHGIGVAVDSSGSVYVTGLFKGNFTYPVDFAPSGPPCNEDPDEHTTYSDKGSDAFLTKHFPDGCW